MKTVEIKIWMLRNGFRQAQVAADLGVSRPLVSMTIHGHGKNRRVLDWLRDRGCPAEYLDLPRGKVS
jgi:predicted XRE-type DNA-binding protein